MNSETHIADEELLLALDGELSPAREAEVRLHLQRCWNCRARSASLDQAAAAYTAFHEKSAAEPVTPSLGPSALLRARLRQAPPSSWAAWRPAAWMKAAAGVAAVALPALLLLGWFRSPAPGPLPDARLTPGATHAIAMDALCRLPAQDEGRLVAPEIARRVFAQYGLTNPRPGTYEVDYLISPALGGSDDIRNLWPVPYGGEAWTSRVKDALEDHLRRMVCAGRMDLATAQRELARDWISAYRRHFGTREPLAEHARFVKDSPWE